MTDKEKLVALLTEFGVEFEDERNKNESTGSFLICKEGATRVDGYRDFYTLFGFDKDGKLMQMGAWE